MLRYENIEYLNLLLLIPIVILIVWWFERWRKNVLTNFGDYLLIEKLSPSYSATKNLIRHISTVLVFLLIIIGLSNPQIGTKMEEVKREGVDLMIAIDLSNSMLTEDIQPNRLERAKQAISKLIDKLQGDRIGLVVFAGEAYVQLPITTDYSAAKLFLSTINTNIIPTQGTNIGNAIDLCMRSFDSKNQQNKAIIIITDGEDHDENVINSAKKAFEANIFIHTLGMGLTKGGPIPIYKYGRQVGFRKDNNGDIVVSKLNEKMLQEIAKIGHGSYVRANNTQAGLSILFSEINKLEKKEIGTMIFTEYKDRFQLFIGLTLLFLILNITIGNKKITNYV
ncbi:MAG: VWA domain-containing protein [Bacteroidota bacterium]|nr:VWA domain-containing protein [Bacteroidota bacterium]